MEIKIDNSAQDYLKSLKYMENRVNEIIKNQNDELAWLLSHPAIYTSGSTDHKSDLLNNNKIPVIKIIPIKLYIASFKSIRIGGAEAPQYLITHQVRLSLISLQKSCGCYI